jgi:hypothetical protein
MSKTLPLPLLYLALTLCLAAGAAAFVFQAAAALKSDDEIDYGEGIVMWQAANVTDWEKAFHPLENYPHNVFHYTPLFHLTSRFVGLFTRNLLTAGRLTSILSLIGTCLVGALLVARVLPPGRNKFARFMSSMVAGTLISTTETWYWATLMRVDTLAIFLSICGVALFVLARKRRTLGFVAFVFFVAAVYTKQTSLPAPIACLILAFIEKPRYAFQLLAFSVSLGLVILAMLHVATDGLFLRHIIYYNQNPYNTAHLFAKLRFHASTVFVPLCFSAMLPLGLLYRRMGRGMGRLNTIRFILNHSNFERCVIVVGLHLCLAAILAAATISKSGAWTNYYFETDVTICLMSGLFVGWVLRHCSFRPQRFCVWLQGAVIGLFIVQTYGNWHTLFQAASAYPPVDQSREVVNFLKGLPDPVYSENMVILMLAGKEVPAEPAIITALADDGKWDESGFVARIRNGEFRAIVVRWSLTNRGRFTEAVAKAVEERYYLTNEFEPFKVYLPR